LAHLQKVHVPKASDVLAGHLREQILSGALAEGAALPVERELAASVGLGRGTVRDALRTLEIEGLIVTRPGRSGGSFVRRPDMQTFERSLNALIGGGSVRFRSLLEAREALEPAAARLAAHNRTDNDLTVLDQASERLVSCVNDIPRFLVANVDWHLAVSAASHNEVIQAIVSSLAKVLLKSTEIESFNSEKTMKATIRVHDRVVEAIRRRDADEAGRLMTAHVHTYAVLAERHGVPPDADVMP
jgi:DNA-binding FadR family transcriptional regulator